MPELSKDTCTHMDTHAHIHAHKHTCTQACQKATRSILGEQNATNQINQHIKQLTYHDVAGFISGKQR